MVYFIKLAFFQELRENFKEPGSDEILDTMLQIQLKSTDQSGFLSMKKVLKVEETTAQWVALVLSRGQNL